MVKSFHLQVATAVEDLGTEGTLQLRANSETPLSPQGAVQRFLGQQGAGPDLAGAIVAADVALEPGLRGEDLAAPAALEARPPPDQRRSPPLLLRRQAVVVLPPGVGGEALAALAALEAEPGGGLRPPRSAVVACQPADVAERPVAVVAAEETLRAETERVLVQLLQVLLLLLLPRKTVAVFFWASFNADTRVIRSAGVPREPTLIGKAPLTGLAFERPLDAIFVSSSPWLLAARVPLEPANVAEGAMAAAALKEALGAVAAGVDRLWLGDVSVVTAGAADAAGSCPVKIILGHLRRGGSGLARVLSEPLAGGEAPLAVFTFERLGNLLLLVVAAAGVASQPGQVGKGAQALATFLRAKKG